jgi:hypothetical protein
MASKHISLSLQPSFCLKIKKHPRSSKDRCKPTAKAVLLWVKIWTLVVSANPMNNASPASAVKVSVRVYHRVWTATMTPIVTQVCSVKPRLRGPTNQSALNNTKRIKYAQMTISVSTLTSAGSRQVRSEQLTPNGAWRYSVKKIMLSLAGTARTQRHWPKMTLRWMDATVRVVLPPRLH